MHRTITKKYCKVWRNTRNTEGCAECVIAQFVAKQKPRLANFFCGVQPSMVVCTSVNAIVRARILIVHYRTPDNANVNGLVPTDVSA